MIERVLIITLTNRVDATTIRESILNNDLIEGAVNVTELKVDDIRANIEATRKNLIDDAVKERAAMFVYERILHDTTDEAEARLLALSTAEDYVEGKVKP